MAQSFETVAAFRFGYGFSPSEPDTRNVADLLAQVTGPDLGLRAHRGLDFTTRHRMMREFLDLRKEVKNGNAEAKPLLRQANKARNSLRADDVRNLFMRALFSGQGFRERLTFFWADHFTIVPKSRMQKVIWGTYQEDAIRPHLAGSFADLLISAVTHPSMMLFLDQVKSIGPNSEAAKTRKKRKLGLNENLAREILELHTMGVGGAYSQTDVRQLAELLTGLVVDEEGSAFRPRRAEPGDETVLGKTYGGDPARRSDIDAFLRDVAAHPDTAAHISGKLAVHFVSDTPDPAMVAEMTQTYLQTGGDLPSVYGTMLDHPSAWVDLGQKARQPFDFMVSALRALGVAETDLSSLTNRQVQQFLALPLTGMGQPLQAAPGPNGWPEEAEAWITAQGVAARLQWSLAMARRLGGERDPRQFVAETLRELAGETLKFAVAGAEQREEGLTLVLASPEFNRR